MAWLDRKDSSSFSIRDPLFPDLSMRSKDLFCRNRRTLGLCHDMAFRSFTCSRLLKGELLVSGVTHCLLRAFRSPVVEHGSGTLSMSIRQKTSPLLVGNLSNDTDGVSCIFALEELARPAQGESLRWHPYRWSDLGCPFDHHHLA
eukprot:4341119-Amphidinium_carterae.2